METKTITLTQEECDFLIGLRDELNAQSDLHKWLAAPYFFQVAHKEVVPSWHEGEGRPLWVNSGDQLELCNEFEIIEYLTEYYGDEWEQRFSDEHVQAVFSSEDQDATVDSIAKQMAHDIVDTNAVETLLENLGFDQHWVEDKVVYANCFLTEKSCKRHIEQNKHHYNSPKSVAQYAFRSRELEKLLKIIRGLESSTK